MHPDFQRNQIVSPTEAKVSARNSAGKVRLVWSNTGKGKQKSQEIKFIILIFQTFDLELQIPN